MIFERPDHPDLKKMFGRHVHWGYWKDPSQAKPEDAADFSRAAEAMTELVCDVGLVSNQQRILDVGCGFGGTLQSLNDRFSGLSLLGLNIDPRQIALAEKEFKPSKGNQVKFVQGDACRLPFADSSFDVVLAVECIFHFPSRLKFFREAQRVLAPGGRLVVSDFVPDGRKLLTLTLASLPKFRAIRGFYGKTNPICPLSLYKAISSRAGLRFTREQDITLNTLPTYPALLRLGTELGKTAVDAVRFTELCAQKRWINYRILSFEK